MVKQSQALVAFLQDLHLDGLDLSRRQDALLRGIQIVKEDLQAAGGTL